MNPLEQIDAIFFWLKERIITGGYHGYHNIENYVKQTPELGINTTILIEILKRLQEDGYITKTPPPQGISGQPVYNVSFKGLLFDGYVKAKTQADLDVAFQRGIANATLDNANLLNRLTIWLAIFAGISAVYYAIEIVKYFSGS